MDANVFGKRLDELIELKKIQQIDLANFFKVASSTVSQWKTGKRDPGLDMVKKIADYFNCTADYLLGLSDIRQPDVAMINAEREDNDKPFTEDDIRILEEMVQHLKRKHGTDTMRSADNERNTKSSGRTGDKD